MKKYLKYLIAIAVTVPFCLLWNLIVFGEIDDSAIIVTLIMTAIVCAIVNKISLDLMAQKYVKYEAYEKKLVVQERNGLIKRLLVVEEHINYSLKYNDPTLVYTGATVGGVHTGGFHVEGGDYSLSSAKKTGKFYLAYQDKDLDIWGAIEKIELTPSLAKEAAQNRYLKGFLRNNMLVLSHEVQCKDSTAEYNAAVLKKSLQSGDLLSAMGKLDKSAVYESCLTEWECRKVLDWLCNVPDYLC